MNEVSTPRMYDVARICFISRLEEKIVYFSIYLE